MYIFHKNALLTPNVHNFDALRTFVTKICCCDFRTFSAQFFGLKSRIRKVYSFLDVSKLSLHNKAIHVHEFGLLPLRETTDYVCFWRLSNIIYDNDNSGGGEKALVAVCQQQHHKL